MVRIECGKKMDSDLQFGCFDFIVFGIYRQPNGACDRPGDMDR